MVSWSFLAGFSKSDIVRSFAFIFLVPFFKQFRFSGIFVSYFSLAGYITLKYCILSYSLQENLSMEAALPLPSMLPLCILWDLAVGPDSQMVLRLQDSQKNVFPLHCPTACY